MHRILLALAIGFSLVGCATSGYSARLFTVATSVLERMELEVDGHMDREISKARISGDVRLEKKLLMFWGTVLTALDTANLHLTYAVEADRDGQKELVQKHLYCVKKFATDAIVYATAHNTPFSKGLVLEIAKTYTGKDDHSCQY